MKDAYIEKIYAGWLGKIVGIRFGAPVESWTYEKIRDLYGGLHDYPVDYGNFAADDDSNGPLFFLRALEDKEPESDLTAGDVGDALLNYAPFEHGFFWWGGYGRSTEHTAYLNLRSGIPAPRSGSIAQNGSTVAEQIGGQIFIDTWGLVSPGNPDQAARFAEKAASVTHDRNGVYGGIFVACCIACAFEEADIPTIIQKALSYIPEDCEYARAVRAVEQYHKAHPDHWRDCFHYIQKNWGYAKYPGNCHIIPNCAVMILALLYGKGDFSRTLSICNMCGWDTDCNCGNVGTIMGVRGGLSAIEERWRRPVNDLLICSSVVGSLNIMDLPYGALYITKLAYQTAGEPIPDPWSGLIHQRIDSCHFEFPGSTHACHIRVDSLNPAIDASKREVRLFNTDEAAHTGRRSLKFTSARTDPADKICIYKKTYYLPQDFHDDRYEPCFSPLVYPGQTVHGSIMIPDYSREMSACLYVRDAYTGEEQHGPLEELKKGEWRELSFQIPPCENTVIGEMGFLVYPHGESGENFDCAGLIDDLYADGTPDYSLDFANSREDVWTGLHREISQFTRLKGLLYLEEGQLHLSCADFAEAYTGRYDWTDYRATFCLTPLTGEHHQVNVRVQGAMRSYAFALMPGEMAAILKNDKGYSVLCETEYRWKAGRQETVEVTVCGSHITARIVGRDGEADTILEAEDHSHRPWLTGSIGVSVREGSHAAYRSIEVRPVEKV